MDKELYALDKKFIKEQVGFCDGNGNYSRREVLTDLDSLVEFNGKLMPYRELLAFFDSDRGSVVNGLTGEVMSRKEWKSKISSDMV